MLSPHFFCQRCIVESRMGAVAYSPVSHPRSSNRTCGATASGFPTGFTPKYTAGSIFQRPVTLTEGCFASAPYAIAPSPYGKAFSGESKAFWCLQAHRQSPLFISFNSTPEANAFPACCPHYPGGSVTPLYCFSLPRI